MDLELENKLISLADDFFTFYEELDFKKFDINTDKINSLFNIENKLDLLVEDFSELDFNYFTALNVKINETNFYLKVITFVLIFILVFIFLKYIAESISSNL